MAKWRVEQRRESWYVVWTGRAGGTIHDEHSYLSEERAVAVAEALNRTEAAEVRVRNRIRREVMSWR